MHVLSTLRGRPIGLAMAEQDAFEAVFVDVKRLLNIPLDGRHELPLEGGLAQNLVRFRQVSVLEPAHESLDECVPPHEALPTVTSTTQPRWRCIPDRSPTSVIALTGAFPPRRSAKA